jgi:ATP cone domain
MEDEVKIVKASGERVSFSDQKLRRSMRRSGANERVIDQVVEDVKAQLHEGMTTKKIYQLAFRLLKKNHRQAASKYKLKNAILELGPSGFPFEKYIAEIFKSQGHRVQLNQIMKGRCVDHEVDVVAERDSVVKLTECKFHNSQGTICDVKVPLYVHSRFKDITAAAPENKRYEPWVVTNTRFSTDAVLYGTCAELNLWGWDFPDGKGLRDIVDNTGLYPITCLTTLTEREKDKILESGVLLCRDLDLNNNTLRELRIPYLRIEGIIREASNLCNSSTQQQERAGQNSNAII